MDGINSTPTDQILIPEMSVDHTWPVAFIRSAWLNLHGAGGRGVLHQCHRCFPKSPGRLHVLLWGIQRATSGRSSGCFSAFVLAGRPPISQAVRQRPVCATHGPAALPAGLRWFGLEMGGSGSRDPTSETPTAVPFGLHSALCVCVTCVKSDVVRGVALVWELTDANSLLHHPPHISY